VVWDINNPLFEENFINVNALYIPNECHLIASVWSGTKGRLYRFDQDNMNNHKLLMEHEAYAHDMDGQHMNDIIIGGSYNMVEHYNGTSVFNYTQLLGGGWNLGLCYSEDRIFIAGQTTGGIYQGIVIRGERF
jgi:hypothetical protein